WSVPAPEMEPDDARRALVRRYLNVFGPGTAAGLSEWAGIRLPRATRILESLGDERVPVRTRLGDGRLEGWILAEDEAAFAPERPDPRATRLLPSGDAGYLLWGADRELLVPDAARRPELWTPRVWPGALLIGGEIAGVWRRPSAATVAVE